MNQSKQTCQIHYSHLAGDGKLRKITEYTLKILHENKERNSMKRIIIMNKVTLSHMNFIENISVIQSVIGTLALPRQ